ncbi:MAG TPA: cytochrome P450 [Pyrinomonadaceae bacterium]|jgi:cytochrome P450
MSLLPSSIPRAPDVQRFYDEPLGWLARTRAGLGDIFVLRTGGPLFSRARDCAGAVAVFGPAYHRAVLGDIDLYALPVSAAQHLALPPHLINLNRGLHSMLGEQHAQHQRVLMRVLSERSIAAQHDMVRAGLEKFVQSWQVGQRISLLSEMRRLALQVSAGLLFGNRYAGSFELASMLQAYFQLRREAAAPFNQTNETLRAEVIALGTTLDEALRRYIRWCRRPARGAADGIITRLASLELESGSRLSEDELVAHSNVLFISSNEPIAVALTWTLLILSQLPGLRRALRHELAQAEHTVALPGAGQTGRLSLLDTVINESLRLLTPNALMVRVTTRPAELNGVLLPARCELVLCPFLAHRDAERFPQPHEFWPARWHTIKPSPFEYFPFGAGGHACVGRLLAMSLLKAALTLIIPRYELVLAEDQALDWRIHIMFMPRTEPIMTVGAVGVETPKAGRLCGPLNELVSFAAYKKS